MNEQELRYAACATWAEMVDYLKTTFPADMRRTPGPSAADRQQIDALQVAMTAPAMIERARGSGWREIERMASATKANADSILARANGVFMGQRITTLVELLQASGTKRLQAFTDAAEKQCRLTMLGALSPKDATKAMGDWEASHGDNKVNALRRLMAIDLAQHMASRAGERKGAVIAAAISDAAEAEEDYRLTLFAEGVVNTHNAWKRRVAAWHATKGTRPAPENLKIV